MVENEIITATIRGVTFHQEERKLMGATYGTYDSHYLAHLNEYPKGLVIIDSIVTRLHPDWDKKTANRADMLTQELRNQPLKSRVDTIFPNGNFEAVMC